LLIVRPQGESSIFQWRRIRLDHARRNAHTTSFPMGVLRAWILLLGAAALWLAPTAAAAQQEKPEWQRRLDALKLPVDPKYSASLEKANASVNRCFEEAATKTLAIPGRSDQQITDAACKACDRQITDYTEFMSRPTSIATSD
jgi:hypothetical protein